MDRGKIKNYAPKARREFREAVKGRLALFGIKQDEGRLAVEPPVKEGDSVLIGGRAYPQSVGAKRDKLEQAVKTDGFEQTVERLAYTWFNRLVAIRYMELHGYLDHGYRVLSHPDGEPTPEILEHAEHVELQGLDRERVVDLKIEGNKDEALYRLLLIAQCNALHSALPFLFERVDDETDLALPGNLLHSDSLIRKLVSEIDEDDWQEVEIIGWLYQFYISEKKDEVIGKVVASEDIPAATQLFTPNWIVKYLVQNTLGRQWLATYPDSPLRGQMAYYIEPAEQTPEVREQLKAITPTSLNPEQLTLLDPACGSGHILVEAYDLFKAIYQERGYRAKDIPSLILRKNLFGLEIDDRAAQLAAFALLMKARADDQSLFRSGSSSVQPQVRAFQETKGLNAKEITDELNRPVLTQELPPTGKLFEDPGTLFTKATMSVAGEIERADVAGLLGLFEDAKTFGSLIQIPKKLADKLRELEERARIVAAHGEGLNRAYAELFLPFVEQANLLARQYDCVVANPPYMGAKYHSPDLKTFAGKAYPDSKYDTYAMFIQRGMSLVRSNTGLVGWIVMETWMLSPSYEAFRTALLDSSSLPVLLHMPYQGHGNTVMGLSFGLAAFVISTLCQPNSVSSFYLLQHSDIDSNGVPLLFPPKKSFAGRADEFKAIPSHPIAYWASDAAKHVFSLRQVIADVAETASGLQTSDNGRFLRQWHEVAWPSIGFGMKSREEARASGRKWFPHKKGGPFRKWYGNDDYVVNWKDDGSEAFEFARSLYGSPTRIIKNAHLYFREGVTWSHTSSAKFSARLMDAGYIFNVEGPSLFSDAPLVYLGYLCSKPCWAFIQVMNSTLHFLAGSVSKLPFLQSSFQECSNIIKEVSSEAVSIAREDWHSQETAWGFSRPRLLDHAITVQASHAAATTFCEEQICRLKALEEENNRLFIRIFGLEREMQPDVPDEEITHRRPSRECHVLELLSYAIGCMMGRYSLDKPGVIYANAGNVGFDPSQYASFRADDDGIAPLTESDWGLPDDIARRFEEFIAVAWPREHLEENLSFVAESLDSKKGETTRETIRRHLATGFYKHHLQMYKRRPIYWLFSSGKLRAFQCLVYLHRYNEGTLARMRTEYVIPLQGRMAGRIDQLEVEKSKPTSTAHLKKIDSPVKTPTTPSGHGHAKARHVYS